MNCYKCAYCCSNARGEFGCDIDNKDISFIRWFCVMIFGCKRRKMKGSD